MSLNDILNSPFINPISLILAILGIGLAVFFYIKSKKYRLPIYIVRNVNLIKEKVEKINNLDILYRGDQIDNLSICNIAFWNRGKETINKSDIAPSDKVRIVSTGGANLLELKIIYKKKKANNFSLEPKLANEVLIDFDYFDWNEGIIVQVFHTGKTSENIKIIGTIKGAEPIKKIGYPFLFKVAAPFSYLEKLKRKYRKLILGNLLIFTPVLLIALNFLPNIKIQSPLWIKYVLFLFFLLVYWSMAFTILHRRVPRGFELFEEELIPTETPRRGSPRKI